MGSRRIVAGWLFLALLLAARPGASRETGFDGRIIRNVTYVQRGLQPLRMTVYRPAGDLRSAPAVMVIHGGGFVGGFRRMMDPLCRTIAARGMVAFNVEYRLGPWQRLPASVQDARCGLRWIARHAPEYGGDPSRLGVTGESAGAYLSAMTFLPPPEAFNDEPCPDAAPEMPTVKAAVLDYGLYDMAKSYDYDFPAMHLYYRLAMRGRPDRAPEYYRLISPLTYLHSGLPPILIQVGDRDPLYPESEDLQRRLRGMGERVEFQVYPGAGHGFILYPSQPPGLAGRQLTADFFQAKL